MNIVLILGMHRSGTSMMSQILRALGVHMGIKLDEHYEDEDFKSLNIDILSQAGGSWHQPPRQENIIKQNWSVVCIQKLIEVKSRENTLWGWKDPRMCLLIGPLYWQVLKDYNVKIVAVKRQKFSVVASLQEREAKRGVLGIQKDNWESLVDHYNDSLCSFLSDYPEVPVYYVDYEYWTQLSLNNSCRMKLINDLCTFLNIEPKNNDKIKAYSVIRCRK